MNMMRLGMGAAKAYPDARIGMVVNRRTIMFVDGWLHNGKTDNAVNMEKVLAKGDQLSPGDVFRITGDKEGAYGMKKIDTSKPMAPGLYLVRHGLTAWNGESYDNKPIPPPLQEQ